MSNNASTLKTLSDLTNMFARVGGVLVGLSAISYYVGYKIESHYLSQAGASWAISLLSFSELVREGQYVIVVIGIGLFFSLINIFENDDTANDLKRTDQIFNGIGMLLLLAAFATSKFYENYKLDYILSILAGGFMTLAAGFTIGELVARLDESKRAWNGYHLKLLFFFYMSAIVLAPYFIGSNKARLDLELEKSSLPEVKIVDEESGRWRLLRTVGDSYLLVSLTKQPAEREFRLAPISIAVVVVSTARNE